MNLNARVRVNEMILNKRIIPQCGFGTVLISFGTKVHV